MLPYNHVAIILHLPLQVLRICAISVTLSSKGTHRRMSSKRKIHPQLLTGACCSDFPGGEGEAQFKGRAGVTDIPDAAGRRALGFEPFKYSTYLNEGEKAVVAAANQILGF